ncbi:MAG: Cell Wall Hydrolase [Rhodobacteraceae bacterium HLUCCA12]|nr:MAG: Cell Wall Hydrolase [Rhodobacteraceae bacterium HLUCCA12]
MGHGIRKAPFGALSAFLVMALVAVQPATAEVRVQQGLMMALDTEREAIRRVPASLIVRSSEAQEALAARRLERAWLMQQPVTLGEDRQFQCLQEAIYHEARGETIAGQFAVAEVILNRVDLPSFPDSVCDVVHQNANRRNACQFSYACNGRSRTMAETGARELAGRIAQLMLSGTPRELTDGATHFHTTAVRPVWSRRFAQTAQIGTHLFYRAPVQLSSN